MSFKTYVAPLVTTSVPLTGFRVASDLTIKEGTPALLSLELTPSVPYPSPAFTVTSSDPTVAVAGIVHNHQLAVIGVSPGTADVTIASGGLSSTVSITVDAYAPPVFPAYVPPARVPSTSIALTVGSRTVTPRIQFDIGAIILPSNWNEDALTWSTSNAAVAIIADESYKENRTGISRIGNIATVRAIAAGTATITATVGANSATCTVTVV